MTFQDTAAPSSANYLTRIALDQQEQNWQMRPCNVLFNVVFPLKGVRQICKAQLRVLEISEGGLRATTHRRSVPDHFYISIGDNQYQVACAVAERRQDGLEIRFLQDLPSSFIDVVASLEDPFALLEEIRPALYGLEGLAN